MATNKPIGDNARKGAVKKRSQAKGKVMGETFTKRNKEGGQFGTEEDDEVQGRADREMIAVRKRWLWG